MGRLGHLCCVNCSRSHSREDELQHHPLKTPCRRFCAPSSQGFSGPVAKTLCYNTATWVRSLARSEILHATTERSSKILHDPNKSWHSQININIYIHKALRKKIQLPSESLLVSRCHRQWSLGARTGLPRRCVPWGLGELLPFTFPLLRRATQE